MEQIGLPSNYDEFVEARKEGFIKAKKYKETGKILAGGLCSYLPVEILVAAGISTIGLCGTSNETIPDAEQVLPKNLCPMVKSTYGFALSGKCPFTYFSDIIVGETTCDGKKKMYELLGEMKEVYILQIPQNPTRCTSGDFWYNEVKLFKRKIEERFGVEITEEMLRLAVKRQNRLRRAMIDLYEIQQMIPPVMKGTQIMLALQQTTFTFDLDEQISNVEKLVETAKSEYEAGKRPVSIKAKRILITGCPSGGLIQKVGMSIENNGGVIVCVDDCSGERTNRLTIDENADDILRAISDRYLQVNCAVMSPNENRIESIKENIEKYNVDGVIEIILQACHTFNIEAVKTQRAISDMGVPYLRLETDYSEIDTGQIDTRIAAFIEMLSNN